MKIIIPMDDNWNMIFSSSFDPKVELLKALLRDEGIESVIVNKKDSAYLFGELELYVQSDHAVRAKRIINKSHIE